MRPSRRRSAAGRILTALGALALYRRQVLPVTRRDLERWRARAAEMPEGALREAALSALTEKRANPEATAVFAILAPRGNRDAALRAMTALQVAIDYLDLLSEEAVEDPLANGLSLHRALVDAVTPGAESGDWYALASHGDDGGFLAALVDSCRQELTRLPASRAALPVLQRAARRCGEGQSHSHAAAYTDTRRLRSWAAEQETQPGYRWWEVAAGASSSVAVHAVIATAADPQSTDEQAQLVDAAYFPSIGALTVLLDHLVDREADRSADEHNYLSYYRDGAEAGDRIGLLAKRAQEALPQLPRHRRHGAILAGVAGFYLGAAGAEDEYARPVRERLLESLGPDVRPIMIATGLGRDG